MTSGGEVAWFVNEPRPATSPEERATTTTTQWQDHLAALVEPGVARSLVERGVVELAGDSTHDLPHVPVWHDGRTVLIGDAAHAPSPSSGQGASLAAEDAVVLALAVRDQPDVPAALAAYEAARRDRVERIVAVGARSGSSKIPGRLGRGVRDLALRAVFRWAVTERSTAWMYDHRLRWAEVTGEPR